MAIIPANEKVFMVSNSTNTTYSGSASLKAMNEWYTMSDIIDSIPVTPPVASTFQEVLEAGNIVTTQTMSISTPVGLGSAVNISNFANDGIGVIVTTYGAGNPTGLTIDSSVHGINAKCIAGTAVFGESSGGGVGGEFTSEFGSYALISNQEAAKPGGGSWAALSDSRVKEAVVPYTKGLNEILLVNPVNYKYNGLAKTQKGKEYTGVIAQEIKDIFPETVNIYKAKLNDSDEEKTELYDFNSTALTFALINAVKELKAEIDLLKAV